MRNTLIADIETNGFQATRLHTLVVIRAETSDVYSFADQPGFRLISEGIAMLEVADQIVGHNFLQFDLKWLEKLRQARIDRSKVLDTLVAARILWPDLRDSDTAAGIVPAKLLGRHSLEAWGYRLAVLKGNYGKTADWKYWSPAMQNYCEQDCLVSAALYLHILEAGDQA
jgi:DNA polymerase III epsilon subunit-like protein